ncbi:hypothetical protein MHBO_002810, partial [Bonamia ostreae]
MYTRDDAHFKKFIREEKTACKLLCGMTKKYIKSIQNGQLPKLIKPGTRPLEKSECTRFLNLMIEDLLPEKIEGKFILTRYGHFEDKKEFVKELFQEIKKHSNLNLKATIKTLIQISKEIDYERIFDDIAEEWASRIILKNG